MSETEMEPVLRDYLRLDDDLNAIYRSIDRDGHMHDVIARHKGMRLLRQEPWECLIAFILSANSNIPRISATMENMSRRLGKHLSFRRHDYYTFPSPEVLVAVEEKGLRALGLGFRARYVAQASRVVAEGELRLEELRSMPYEEARGALMEVPGVGEKVADCVFLFSLDKLEAFPIDRWVRRAVVEWYFEGKSVSYKAVRAWATEYFGAYAGYAQQYLFHGRRLER
jgi:N-glycosylase/DNA lyase